MVAEKLSLEISPSPRECAILRCCRAVYNAGNLRRRTYIGVSWASGESDLGCRLSFPCQLLKLMENKCLYSNYVMHTKYIYTGTYIPVLEIVSWNRWRSIIWKDRQKKRFRYLGRSSEIWRYSIIDLDSRKLSTNLLVLFVCIIPAGIICTRDVGKSALKRETLCPRGIYSYIINRPILVECLRIFFSCRFITSDIQKVKFLLVSF